MRLQFFLCEIVNFYFMSSTFLFISNSAKSLHEKALVFPKLIESRSERLNKVVQITEELTLDLEKSSVLDKEFLLRTYQGPLMKHTYLDGEILEENLYHDAGHFASIMISETGGLKVEGVLGPNLRIKPLLEQERTMEGDIPHLLYVYTDEGLSHEGQDLEAKKIHVNMSARQDQQPGPEIPDSIYPEILVMVDSTFRNQFSSEEYLLDYITTTFNSMNVRYTTVSQPMVKLRLRALEILTEYKEYFFYRVGDNTVAGVRTLQGLRDHVNQNPDKYEAYDAVYLLTGLDIVSWNGRDWEYSLQGVAYVGGACGYEKVGFGEDQAGTYRGVRIGAHEIAHLLGCPHDGSHYGQYSSAECPWSDGFIMSYLLKDSRSMKFSSCCDNMITLKVGSSDGKCLRELTTKRKIKKKLFSKKLPGDILSRDELCRRAFPHVPETYFMVGHNGDAQCHARCFIPARVSGTDTFRFIFLADHTPCNSSAGKYCINGDCVANKMKYEQYRPAK